MDECIIHAPQFIPRYSSRRSLVYGTRGMAATSQPLATMAGINILKAGGNAVDAAIAMAAMMTVVEPCSNGLGGDGFGLVWFNDKLYGMNSSGRAPALLNADLIRSKGYDKMPIFGMEPITVPGVVRGWKKLHDEFGTLPFERLLKDAINTASGGFAVTPVISELWQREVSKRTKLHQDVEIFKGFFDTFTIEGRAPKAGEIWKCESMADTLDKIASTEGEAMYSGELADEIEQFFIKNGGYIRKSDLEAHTADFVEPIKTNYRGYDIWEIPPNGQGITALMALNIVKKLAINSRNDTDTIHNQMEAMKLAYTDAKAFVSDPDSMKVEVEELLSDSYAAQRAKLIGDKALYPTPGKPSDGGTIYLCCADKWGNMVSLIQSNYKNFGSGIVIPGTGISMHNRGLVFSLNPDEPNYLEPRKRPYHTIIPGFITKDKKAVGPFGVMGGYMQPQGHMQVIMNMLDFGMDPQTALDAPRWQWVGEKRFEMESAFSPEIVNELSNRGHEIKVNPDYMDFGRGQIIIRKDDGVYMGATEPRADGACIGI